MRKVSNAEPRICLSGKIVDGDCAVATARSAAIPSTAWRRHAHAAWLATWSAAYSAVNSTSCDLCSRMPRRVLQRLVTMPRSAWRTRSCFSAPSRGNGRIRCGGDIGRAKLPRASPAAEGPHQELPLLWAKRGVWLLSNHFLKLIAETEICPYCTLRFTGPT